MFKLKQFVSSDYCLKCDNCCRFSQQDTIWLPRLLNEEKEKLDKKIRLLSNPKHGNFICACFNIQDNKCKIYSFRPFECQIYPFLINRKEENIFLAVDLRCPFIRENLKSEKFKEYISYLAKFLNNPSVPNMLRSNPQIIQTYTEVINLAELKF